MRCHRGCLTGANTMMRSTLLGRILPPTQPSPARGEGLILAPSPLAGEGWGGGSAWRIPPARHCVRATKGSTEAFRPLGNVPVHACAPMVCVSDWSMGVWRVPDHKPVGVVDVVISAPFGRYT